MLLILLSGKYLILLSRGLILREVYIWFSVIEKGYYHVPPPLQPNAYDPRLLVLLYSGNLHLIFLVKEPTLQPNKSPKHTRYYCFTASVDIKSYRASPPPSQLSIRDTHTYSQILISSFTGRALTALQLTKSCNFSIKTNVRIVWGLFESVSFLSSGVSPGDGENTHVNRNQAGVQPFMRNNGPSCLRPLDRIWRRLCLCVL